jgi:hypothetical protein
VSAGRSTARSRIATTVLALTALSLVPVVIGTAGSAVAGTRCPSGATNVPHRAGRAPRVVGWLHSCRDGTIRTGKGQKIRLEGLEYFASAGGATGAGACDGSPWFPPSYAGADMRSWGFNEVELFISWQNVEPKPPTRNAVTGRLVHHYDRTYLLKLDHAIAQFKQAGVAVVLVEQQARWSAAFQNIDGGYKVYKCGQGMPAWIYERDGKPAGGGAEMVRAEVNFFQNRKRVWNWGDPKPTVSEPIQTSFVKMWRFIAKRYRLNSTVVGVLPMWEPYDILTRNYPGASSVTREMLHLARFFEVVGGAIHRVSPRVLLIFPEQLSRRTGLWSLTRRPKVPNGVMGGEFYAKSWATDGVTRMRLHVARAHNWHYPFDVDEFDAFGKTTNQPHTGWTESLAKMLTYCRKHHVSWTLLSYKGIVVPGSPHQANPELLPIIRKGF